MHESPKTVETITNYERLLVAYTKARQELREFENTNRFRLTDPSVSAKSRVLDSELHKLHLKLEAEGSAVGKGTDEVTVDIFRQENSLKALGLPEFGILTSEDLFPFFKDALMDPERFYPAEISKQNKKIPLFDNTGNAHNLKQNEVMIVYDAMVFHHQYNLKQKYELPSPDWDIRRNRMRELAETVGGRIEAFQDYENYHNHTITVVGIVISKDRLYDVIAFIYSRPQRFRIGKEFYNEEEQRRSDTFNRDWLVNTFSMLAQYEREEDAVREIHDFLMAMKSAHGKDAYIGAQQLYTEWKETKKKPV